MRCYELNIDWGIVKTTPELPVNHGDTIQLSCQTGYKLAGTDTGTATCFNGTLVTSSKVTPTCFGNFVILAAQLDRTIKLEHELEYDQTIFDV